MNSSATNDQSQKSILLPILCVGSSVSFPDSAHVFQISSSGMYQRVSVHHVIRTSKKMAADFK